MLSKATIKTEKAGRYLQQLCKHFGHKVDVEFDDHTGWVKLPMGRADLAADDTTLTMSVNADDPDDLAKAQDVMQSHLERFAFREDLEIRWDAASQPLSA